MYPAGVFCSRFCVLFCVLGFFIMLSSLIMGRRALLYGQLAIIFCGNFDSHRAIIVISRLKNRMRSSSRLKFKLALRINGVVCCIRRSIGQIRLLFWGTFFAIGMCTGFPPLSPSFGGALMKHFLICQATPPHQPLPGEGEIALDGSRSPHNRTCRNNNVGPNKCISHKFHPSTIVGPKQLISNCIWRCHYV